MRRARHLASRIPFFYGWIIVGCAICASFARQGAAVATLSVFVEPMTREFEWSRTALSGAVSLGGVLAALLAPAIGPVVDRIGARLIIVAGAVVVGLSSIALANTTSLLWFYVAFSIGRLTFASSFDIGISAAIANWFVARRAQAMSYVTLGATLSLAAMPLLAFAAIDRWGWRAGWWVIAATVVVMGVTPNLLLMVRRPEDVGLVPDGSGLGDQSGVDRAGVRGSRPEREFTRRQALHTPALWLLMLYSALIFPVQAGISLHQAPHIIQQGLSATIAATVVSTYSLLAALSAVGFGLLVRWWPIRVGLALSAGFVAVSAVAMQEIASAAQAYGSAALFGAGVGGVLTLLPVAWADYFGRRHFGAIRGITLPVQVLAQAAGPLLAGILHDRTGSYQVSFGVLAFFATGAAAIALLALPPRTPD